MLARKKVKAKKSSKKKLPVSKKAKNNTAQIALRESQRKLKIALQAASMGVWEWNIRTNVVTWSDQVHEIFGRTPETFDGSFEAYVNLIYPEDKDHVLKTIQHSLTNKESYFIQHRIMWPDGTIHWMEALGNVILDRNGNPVKMTGSAQDITLNKKIALENEDWKLRYELLASASGQVIYDYDIASGYIIWSGNIFQVLGYQADEMGDIKTWVELIHPDDRKQAFQKLEEAEKALRPYDVTYRFRNKSGDYVYMHDRGFFTSNANDKAERMLGSMQDITTQRQSEETIRANHRLRESIENALPDILYVYDLKSQINVYANRNLIDVLGYTPEELTKMGPDFINQLVHPDDMQFMASWADEPMNTIKESEYRMLTRSGEWRWFRSRDTVFQHAENGNVSQIVGVARDITEQRKAISALRESEERFRNLIQDLNIGVLLQGPQSEIILFNKAALEMLDLTEDTLRGKTSLDPTWNVIHEDGTNFPGEDHPVPSAIKSMKPVRGVVMGVYRPTRQDRVWLLVDAEPIRDSFGNLKEVICTFTDISQLRQTEEQLKESGERFRLLQEASFGGIGLHDQGKLLDCNQGLCTITGYTYDELIGSDGLNLIAPEFRDAVRDKVRSGYDKTYDVEGIRKDGSRYALEIRGKNIPYHGKTIRVTEFRDITERKITEEKIIEQNVRLLTITEDLKRKNEQLEEFTQIVSHNLRSPVGNILTLLNFFESASAPEEKEEYLRLLKESGKNTLNTLQELNDVLNIKQNKNIERQQLNVAEIFAQVKSMLNSQITETNAIIHSDFSQAEQVEFPKIYLESVLLNLLSNALKYTFPGRQPLITFKTYSHQDEVRMEVSDNGLGINLDRYGHQVFKLRKTFHRHPESRGIGLFMVKNQLEAMGGSIMIKSKEKEGTTFIITFTGQSLNHGK
ncbi:MAG: PAS domain-containing protein [Cyclobacteriaceae bacterium]|nr:PAS domain-containing protein [Cyclobacteriaceae bacterium]